MLSITPHPRIDYDFAKAGAMAEAVTMSIGGYGVHTVICETHMNRYAHIFMLFCRR